LATNNYWCEISDFWPAGSIPRRGYIIIEKGHQDHGGATTKPINDRRFSAPQSCNKQKEEYDKKKHAQNLEKRLKPHLQFVFNCITTQYK